MARGSGRGQRGGRGSGVSCRNIGGEIKEPEINPTGAPGGERRREGASDDDLQHEELFTVLLKDDVEWSDMRLPSEMLQDFIAELQRSARLLKIIDEDEHVERLVLELKGGSDGPKRRELGASTSASTLGKVRACMGVAHSLVAVITKLESPSAVPGDKNDVPAHPNTTRLVTDNQHGPACVNNDATAATIDDATDATAAVVVQSDDGPSQEQQSRQQKSPQTSSPSFAVPHLLVSPSSNDDNGVGGLPHGNCKRGRGRPRKVTGGRTAAQHFTQAQLTSDAHLRQREKAAALGVCMSKFKKARREVGFGRWPGRQERARLRHLSETRTEDDGQATIAIADASLSMRGDLESRCGTCGGRCLEERAKDHNDINSNLPGARAERVQREGKQIVGTCKQELPGLAL